MNTPAIKRTATGKEQALVNFTRQLAADAAARPDVYPSTMTELAAKAGVNRSYLSKMMNRLDRRATGEDTWRKILPLLSVPAMFYMKQCSAWNRHAEQAFAEMIEPCRAWPFPLPADCPVLGEPNFWK